MAPSAPRHRLRRGIDRLIVASTISITLTVVIVAKTSSMQAPLQTAPSLVGNNPQPAYPPAARAAGAEGDVQYRAAIRDDGTVESVTILQVPQPNLGFEAAVEDAVTRWRFQPATRDGITVAGTFVGSVHFELSIPGEWIYPVSSRQAWTELERLVRDLKLKIDRLDPMRQILITNPTDYRSMPFPAPDALTLLPGWFPKSVQFHAYVAPGMEPARLAIDSILETTHRPDNRQGALMVYGNNVLSSWFLARLSDRLGKTPEPLAGSALRRAEQSRRLMPPGVSDRCTTREAESLDGKTAGEIRQRGLTPPQIISQVHTLYPKDSLEAKRAGFVNFRGEVTEQGTVINVQQLPPLNIPADLSQAAQLATNLWRFYPAIADGCGARMHVSFDVRFSLKQPQ